MYKTETLLQTSIANLSIANLSLQTLLQMEKW